MPVMFGRIEKPRKISIDDTSKTLLFARFVAEPLERIMGHSIGNALRRILLSSLETPGIMSVRIEGVSHEFMPIEGVIEDMTNIILNIKGGLLRCLPAEEGQYNREPRIITATVEVTQSQLDKNNGQVKITIGDVIQDAIFEVVNPKHHLFTVTKPMSRQIDFRVGYGRGYVPSERHQIPNKMVNEIVIDTAFSPVRLVNYYVENTRVGQDTDYDRLVLEVTTDGRLSPEEALSFASQIAMKNFEVFQNLSAPELLFDQTSREMRNDDDELLEKLLLRIDEIELSVRSTNCLQSANIDTIAELVLIPEKKMLDFRNFGKKSLNEIKAKLSEMNLFLGMDLSHFGMTFENVKDKVKEHHDERRGSGEKPRASKEKDEEETEDE
ncbi:MAG TPA: DNA-directed RNA polymerase subunit alpha [Chlamydiales bacterium]|nr:DNA-directed RNA polymerase subunit alpha [Chlamydiales bacterium]